MATNRYIGARYVPLFTGEWDNAQTYEPLSVVTYQGDSYTSKAYVPVGVAITNTSYWIKTFDYNQQFALLQDTVDTVDGEVDILQDDVSALKTFKQQLPARFQVIAKGVEIGSISGNSAKSGTSANIAQTGLTPLGVVGFDAGDAFLVSKCYLSGSGATVNVIARAYNTDSNALNCEVTAYVLFFVTEGY